MEDYYTDDIDQLKERVLIKYNASLSLDVAFLQAGALPEQEALIRKDERFKQRVAFADADVKADIMGVMLTALRGPDPRLARTAALDLAKHFDKEHFESGNDNKNTIVPDVIILKGKKVAS